jgi:GT2 family glycosyltransferase
MHHPQSGLRLTSCLTRGDMVTQESSSDPLASVIIPTWNGAALLREALDSLHEQTERDFEIIVVDNGSTDETIALLEGYPEVRLVRFETNLGFAAAANAGIRTSRGDVVALLNNDVVAEPGWLAALLDALATHPEVGSCASKMLMYNRPDTIDSAGDRLGVFASNIGHGMPDGGEFQTCYHVLSACAGAAAYRREALDRVGLFDERFFAYLEDVDLGVRLQLAGYDCMFVPGARVRHRGSATAKQHSGFKYHLLMRNSLFLFFQYMPMRRVILWSWLVLAWPLLCAVALRARPRLIWRVYADFLKELPALLRTRRLHLSAATRTIAPLLASPLSRQGS